jgi:hypothetical protein
VKWVVEVQIYDLTTPPARHITTVTHLSPREMYWDDLAKAVLTAIKAAQNENLLFGGLRVSLNVTVRACSMSLPSSKH